MKDQIYNIWDWIKEDWRTHPLRFSLEVACWINNLLIAIIFNTTVPNLPFLLLYPMWIGGSLILSWCCWSRNSFGMLATYLMITIMDMYGWGKVLTQ
jgi:hypothetical protein